jgi:hypothetical protein
VVLHVRSGLRCSPHVKFATSRGGTSSLASAPVMSSHRLGEASFCLWFFRLVCQVCVWLAILTERFELYFTRARLAVHVRGQHDWPPICT